MYLIALQKSVSMSLDVYAIRCNVVIYKGLSPFYVLFPRDCGMELYVRGRVLRGGEERGILEGFNAKGMRKHVTDTSSDRGVSGTGGAGRAG